MTGAPSRLAGISFTLTDAFVTLLRLRSSTGPLLKSPREKSGKCVFHVAEGIASTASVPALSFSKTLRMLPGPACSCMYNGQSHVP